MAEAAVERDGTVQPAGDAFDRPLGGTRGLLGQVVNAIGLRIVGGELPPGTAMPNEADWSQRLGVSRTILREATKVLISKGLVESRPKTGTRVRPAALWNLLDPDVLQWQVRAAPRDRFVREIFELRRMLEPSVAALAAERATEGSLAEMAAALDDMAEAGDDGLRFIDPDIRFHLAILKAVDNSLIRALGGVIETALTTTMRLSLDNPRGQRHSVPLHRAVHDALGRGDAEAARAAMTRLIDGAEVDALRTLEPGGGPKRDPGKRKKQKKKTGAPKRADREGKKR